MHDTAPPIVRIDQLSVRFGSGAEAVRAVEDLSFSVTPGETLGIVGESGSGKSVTALALMRLEEFGGGHVAHGSIRLEARQGGGVELTDAAPARLRRLRGGEVAMIFQEPMTALNPVFTIGQQLAEAVRLHDPEARRAPTARVLELLRQVRIPEPERRVRQYPHELSGGMRQRVMIAMALAGRPRLLIADEPTTALDVTIQADILALLDQLRQELGLAVLLITHDMAVVAGMAQRVIVMQQGRIVEEGPVTQIFNAPRTAHTRALLAAVPRLGEMRGQDGPAPVFRDGIEAVPKAPKAGSTTASPPLLEVRNLTTRFSLRSGLLRRTTARVHAVEDVSFSLARGRTLSLVGESGCGKSTTGRSVLRLIEPESGSLHLDGTDLLSLGPRALRDARKDMQMIFQDPYGSLDPKMKIGPQIIEPVLNYARMTRTQQRDTAARLLTRVRLPADFANRHPHELSGGQRQRVAIARAIALNPKLIVADEAVSALDVTVQAEILTLLMELQAEMGLSCLFISHDMAVVERISHDVAVMYAGRIVERGPRRAVFESPQHAYTKALLAAVPVPDPNASKPRKRIETNSLSSPIHPVGHTPPPSVYREVSPGHHVLTSECGYA